MTTPRSAPHTPAPSQGSTAPSNVAGPDGGGKARVFQGGYYLDLHKMLGVQSGSQVCCMNPAGPDAPACARAALPVRCRPRPPPWRARQTQLV